MILSIVIPFCDNDYQFLDRAVSSIKEHVKFDDYEIIAVFQRDITLVALKEESLGFKTVKENLFGTLMLMT